MKAFRFLTTLFVASLVSCVAPQAESGAGTLDGKSAGVVAEGFLAGYMKALRVEKESDWVAKTTMASAEFKAVYEKAMADAELNSDPVIFAQDSPITPFKAESTKVKGDTAAVVVAAKYNEKETSRLEVTLVVKEGRWLVAKIARVK